ncbi:MAG: hypothetical protein EON58_14420 [Alphaproteobacteria bacterium]|nr:MAG: hypothetical protein EON58_14420 [Alphaproteobacteria bacterium]
MPRFSRDLEETLHRAVHYANERRHEYATLEHLLLALLDDPSAEEVFSQAAANLPELRSALVQYIDVDLAPLATNDGEDAKPTADFQRVVQRAVIFCQSKNQELIEGDQLLIAIFSERESHAAFFLNEQRLTRKIVADVYEAIHGNETRRDLAEDITQSREHAPTFVVSGQKLSYRQEKPSKNIDERKKYLIGECEDLRAVCESRGNSHPSIKRSVDRYSDALEKTSEDSGVYELFMIGIKLENYVKIRAAATIDEDHPEIDAELLIALQSFFVAHAGFVSLFPDIQNTSVELDRYRESLSAISPLNDRLLDPVFGYLARSRNIFDGQTSVVLAEIAAGSGRQDAPAQFEEAAKHGWLRGIFATVADYLLKQSKAVGAGARNAVVTEGVKAALKDSGSLSAALVRFLDDCREHIVHLAAKLPSAFGWLLSLLNLFR